MNWPRILATHVVSNTSPLSNLVIIGQLELLKEQFETVSIPKAASIELARLKNLKAQEQLLAGKKNGWLKVHSLENALLATMLSRHLDRGEAEAIALATEVKADYLLIDERDGCLIARQAGLHITGVLGILTKAKLIGRITSLRKEIETLRSQAHFFVKADLELELLKDVGE